MEMGRLKQVFVNNKYPLSIIDNVINNTLNRFFERNERDTPYKSTRIFCKSYKFEFI